jgi:transposase
VSLAPFISRTYAPRGKTPVITINTDINHRVYLASAISETGDLRYMIRNTPFDTKAMIEFLLYLMSQFEEKLLIIWDGASIHISAEMKAFLVTIPENRLFLAQQPHYSPELNADEQVWQHLKSFKLKNVFNQNINELKSNITNVLDELKENKQLILSFFKHPKLGFYN